MTSGWQEAILDNLTSWEEALRVRNAGLLFPWEVE